MRKAIVKANGREAGILVENNENDYSFVYLADYLSDANSLPISLTMPKQVEEYRATSLFPCFFNLISEGANKATQCRTLHIDKNDYFGLLLATAQYDTAGFLTFTPIE